MEARASKCCEKVRSAAQDDGMNQSAAVIHNKAFWQQPRQRMDIIRAKPRPVGRVAGGWIADLCALGKCVMLCKGCENKFKPATQGYIPYKEPTGVRYGTSHCDGCKSMFVQSRMFVVSPTRG